MESSAQTRQEDETSLRSKIGRAIRKTGCLLLIVTGAETGGMALGIVEQWASPPEPYRAHQIAELADAMLIGMGGIVLSGGIIVLGNNIENSRSYGEDDVNTPVTSGQIEENRVN